MKKSVFKVGLLVVFWLIISVFLYPFTHELGHIIMCILLDAHIVDASYFPCPSVSLCVGNTSNYNLFLIGFSGVIFPLFLAFLMPKKWFLTWFISLGFKAITALAFFISFFSILLGVNNDDDMAKILSLELVDKGILLAISAVFFVVILFIICREKPMKKIETFVV